MSELKELPGGGIVLKEYVGYPPIARNSDPKTSHKAELQHTLGPRAKRARQVLKLVSDLPLYTSGELSRAMHIQYPDLPFRTCAETPHKRLPELFDKGLVCGRGERKCTDSGYMAIQWEITPAGARELG